jgi:hypothetical protein
MGIFAVSVAMMSALRLRATAVLLNVRFSNRHARPRITNGFARIAHDREGSRKRANVDHCEVVREASHSPSGYTHCRRQSTAKGRRDVVAVIRQTHELRPNPDMIEGTSQRSRVGRERLAARRSLRSRCDVGR